MNSTPDPRADDSHSELSSLPIEAGLTEPALSASPHQKPIYKPIYFWVLLGVLLGVVFGLAFPSRNGEPGLAEMMKPLADAFISLIKMLIAPIIFFTVVGGIASVGDLSKVLLLRAA